MATGQRVGLVLRKAGFSEASRSVGVEVGDLPEFLAACFFQSERNDDL